MYKDKDGTVWATEEENEILEEMVKTLQEDFLKVLETALQKYRQTFAHTVAEARGNKLRKCLMDNRLAHIEQLLIQLVAKSG